MSAAAIVAARKKRYVRAFYQQGALSPQTAKTIGEVGQSPSRWFQQMVHAGIFVEVGEGRYYLDQQRWDEIQLRQRRAVLIFCALLLVWIIIVPFLFT